MATIIDHLEQFRAFIKRLCDTDIGTPVADGKWHRFRVADTRHKGSKPGAYLLHVENGRPNGIFVDWRNGDRHKWFADGPVEQIDRSERDRLRKERQDKIHAGFVAASSDALQFWKVCSHRPDGSHPYLDAKKIGFNGARLGTHPAFGLDGLLLIIPVRNIDPKLATLQAIAADGSRRFFKGTTHDGGYTVIGDLAKPGPIAFAEGFATGVTIADATGWAVIVCVTAGNMERIARWASHQYAGRDFIVCGDDDTHLEDKPGGNIGRKKAAHTALILGARLAFPDLQGADGSDFNDQADHYGVEDVRITLMAAMDQQAPEPSLDSDLADDPADGDDEPRAGLPIVSPSQWAGKPVPAREWRLQDLLPNGQATLFTGAGAVGKSLATQQMTSSIAMGQSFLGVRTFPCPALYITCEDDLDELQRRQVAICHALGVTLEATDGCVFLLSLYGELNNALCTYDDNGKLIVSERYTQIVETCLAQGIRHVTLDNTAHFFIGNEIVRSEVAGFVNLCNRMAREIGGTVVIVGHPNKAGDSYSGSTAWENQVRSRIYMETPKSEDGVVIDPDLRVMRNEKANYAQRNKEIRFIWHKGAFALEDQIEEDRELKAESKAMKRDDELFLRLLDQLTAEKRHVSHFPNTGNFAPKLMAGMPGARGASKARLNAAMERLFADERIAASQPLWIGHDRHPVLGLSRKEQAK